MTQRLRHDFMRDNEHFVPFVEETEDVFTLLEERYPSDGLRLTLTRGHNTSWVATQLGPNITAEHSIEARTIRDALRRDLAEE